MTRTTTTTTTTTTTFYLLVDKVVDAPVKLVNAGSLPRRGAEADSHGQACLADHGDFAVAVRAGWSTFLLCGLSKSREACSRCAGRAVYTGTRPGLTPAIRAGKGWRGRRELAPRRSATQFGACFAINADHGDGELRKMLTSPLSCTKSIGHTRCIVFICKRRTGQPNQEFCVIWEDIFLKAIMTTCSVRQDLT